MINRIKHFINGVEFVPKNKDEFTLSANFPDSFTEWENDFSTGNTVIMPVEGYLEILQHLEIKGVGEMPTYTIQIDGSNYDFYVDLYGATRFKGSYAYVSIAKLDDKNTVKQQVDNLTFQYLKSIGKINNGVLTDVPFVVVPDDIGSKLLTLALMIYTITREIIDTSQQLVERVGDLLSATIPSAGLGVVYPLGNVARLATLIAMDVAKLILLTIAFKKLIQQAFELLVPPVRIMKGMTFDRLLSIGLGHINMTYSSSLKSEFQRFTVVGVPIDFQNKKFFDILLGFDDRVLNRGYPTASDSVPTLGALIEEICKMFNIQPRINGAELILEPKQNNSLTPTVTLDDNFADQDIKEIEKELDLSKLWNTKIISYQNDQSDTLLFDNPKGLRVEYKTTTMQTPNAYTKVKGIEDIRINFALATRKKETKLDEFLKDLAKVADQLLNTSFLSKLKNREGVMAISRDQFFKTKLIYQIGGKQPENYLSKIGSQRLYKDFHKIDESKNNVNMITQNVRVRMDNSLFDSIIDYNFVFLGGKEVEILTLDYLPEMGTAEISYREKKNEWGDKLKTIKVYEE